MIVLILFMLQLPFSSNAISWSMQRRTRSLTEPLSTSVSEVEPMLGDDTHLTPSEMESLFLHNKFGELDSYAHKTDCFRRTAKRIRVHCSELDMDEDARVEAAIRMTLCELATARLHSPPLECAPFALSAEEWLQRESPESRGNCVEALSRSAQFWSSYSGYLREIPQLCYAFRRWHDIDTAKDIYRNATLEKLALVKFVRQRDETALCHLRKSEEHLDEMRDLAGRIRHSSEAFALFSDEVALRLSSGYEQTLALLKDAITVMQRQDEEDHAIFLSRTDHALQQLLHHHSVALAALLPTFTAAIASNVNDLFTSIQGESVAVLDLMNDIDQKWTSFNTHFSTLDHTISHLIQAAINATDVLAAHSALAHSAHALQTETNVAAMELAQTVTRLNTVTLSEIERINITAGETRERMLAWEREREEWKHVWEMWMWNAIQWAGTVILKVDPSSIEHIVRWPIFRLALVIVRALCSVLQAVFSSLMAITVVFISSKKYFSRPASKKASLVDSLPSSNLSLPLCNHVAMPSVNTTTSSLVRDHSPYHCSKTCSASHTYHYSRTYPNTQGFSRIPDRLCKPVPSFC